MRAGAACVGGGRPAAFAYVEDPRRSFSALAGQRDQARLRIAEQAGDRQQLSGVVVFGTGQRGGELKHRIAQMCVHGVKFLV